jgi:energy-coupling factor transport system permease protein
LALEYIPGNTFFHKLDPRTKMLLFLCLVVITTFILDPVGVLVLLVVLVAFYDVAKIPFGKLWGITKPLFPAMIMFFLLNFFFVAPPEGSVVYGYMIPPNLAPITVEGVLIGITNVLRFVLFIWAVRLVTLMTPITDILLGSVKLGMPIEISTALGIAFSYVPFMIHEFRTVIEAQRSRGAQIEHRNPIRKMRAFMPVLVPSIYLAILRGMDIARAIESRAFSYNPAKRTYRRQLILQRRDKIFGALLILSTVAVGILRFYLGWLGYTFTFSILARLLVK